MAGVAATVMSVLPFLFIDAIQTLLEKTDEAFWRPHVVSVSGG
jgi:hypothetical protein